jgi:alkylated DNA repair dioxygenase AlkB
MGGFTQANLFNDEVSPSIEKIEGLTYIPNYITPAQEAELIGIIDGQLWLTDLKRRVQHYGWKYDYTARRVDNSMRLGELPDWIIDYCEELCSKRFFPQAPDQVIINEYQPGQGIASHIDCVPCFEESIASISLGSPCVIDFTHSKTNEKIPLLLEPHSLFVLSGDARYVWKHGIAGRKSDKMNGSTIPRSRRVSMTFRNVIV